MSNCPRRMKANIIALLPMVATLRKRQPGYSSIYYRRLAQEEIAKQNPEKKS